MAIKNVMVNREYRTALYDNYASFQPSWRKETTESHSLWGAAALRRLQGWLPEDKTARCLDLGCGNGRLLQVLAKAGYSSLVGVDRSPQAITNVQARGFTVVNADLCEYLRDSTEYFDLITAFDVIEHFGKDEVLDVIHLIRSRLAPNGRLIIQTPNASSPWASGYRYGDLTHELLYTPDCLTSVLKLAGFGDIAAREVGPHIHGLKSAVRGLGWKFIWNCCALWNLIETGTTQGGIYTRNMMLLCVNNKDSAC